MVNPDDLVQQPVRAKNLIQEQPGVSIGMPIQVQVERAGRCKQAVHQRQPGVKHIQVGIQVLPVHPGSLLPAAIPAACENLRRARSRDG